MNNPATQPNLSNSLALGLSTAPTGHTASRQPPRIPPPPPTTAPAPDGAPQSLKKDNFLAAAALGGTAASIAILLIVSACHYMIRSLRPTQAESAALVQAPPEPVRVVDWPELDLSGILAADSQDGGSAILNGQLVNLHQQLLKVRVVGFTDQRVILEYEGARKALRVGENTL